MQEKRFEAEKGKKLLLSQFLLESNALLTPTEHSSSYLNVDATSHESLQLKYFSSEAVWRLMQYLMLLF